MDSKKKVRAYSKETIKTVEREHKMESSGCCLVSWDFSNEKDIPVALVGIQKNNKVTVINGFTGEEAKEIIKKLTTPSEVWKGEK